MNRDFFSALVIKFLRKLLPRDHDFIVIVWTEVGPQELDITLVSQGNPNEMVAVLEDCLKMAQDDVARHPIHAGTSAVQ
jgi:hypothetical protein